MNFFSNTQERDAAVVLLVAALCLTGLEYFTRPAWLAPQLEFLFGATARQTFDACCGTKAQPLGRLTYWALVNIACYLTLPLLTIRFYLRRPLREFGVRTENAWLAWRWYVLMLGVMLPLVWLMSATSGFLALYPFLRLPPGAPLWPTFLWWELLYFAQFFALEFFFRGFLLHGLAPQLGRLSILVMMLPYCMLHFGKPLPETLASILAGIVLGHLSLKSGSIWLGAVMHCSVALAMDGMALWRKGLLF
ncbi:CPBP family intramembrane glutamic endopeptidase [Massilia sp. W12]|uniref:CPBP family intramembrane glutamic endopeptidase n=1 Tax=Massilia sp. W12 TaxID=3126507 RepID=UPI0030CCBC52